jgi:hypothetical protein
MSKSNELDARPRPTGPEPAAAERSPDGGCRASGPEALELLPPGGVPGRGVRITGCPYDPTCTIPSSWHCSEDKKDFPHD